MPKVSVVIPTHNYGRFLAESLDSVLAQDYDDYEVIVVDDGSTDETQQVLASYDGRVRCVCQRHAGSAAARNTAIGVASGEMIAFQDADDVWLQGSLRQRVDMLDMHPELGMVFADVTVVKGNQVLFPSFLKERKVLQSIEKIAEDGDRFIFTRSVFPDLLMERFVTTPTLLIRRQCFDEAGLWDTSVQDQEDYELQIRMAKRYRLGYINRIFAICRLHGNNITYKTASMNAKRLAVIHRYKNDPDLSALARRALRRRISDLYLESAWSLRQGGDLGGARRHYRLAWTYNRRNYGALLRYAAVLSCEMVASRKERSEVPA